MITLNDWFTNEGIGAWTVGNEDANKALEAGDELVVDYSTDGMGADLGGDFNNNDKSLKALKLTGAKLAEAFSSTTKDYTVYQKSASNQIYVLPTASNKNFQVRTTVGDKTYKRTQPITTKPGTAIKVTDGDPSWPTMNSAADVPAQTYTINVKAAKGYTTTVSGAKYQVTNQSKNYVTYVKAPSKKAAVTVPATVKIGGTSYKVTKVATKAFANNKTVKTVKIGKNVTKIAKSAFYKTPNLKKVSVSSKNLQAKSTVKSSFKGSQLKKTLTVNANQIAAKYVKKSFTKKNLATPTKVVYSRTVKAA